MSRAAVIRISVWVVAVLLFVVFVSGVLVISQLSAKANRSAQVRFSIAEGVGIRSIAGQLEQKGVISSANLFLFGAYLRGHTKDLQAGEYVIPSNASIFDIISEFSEGKVEEEKTVTILEGWNNQQIAEYLEKKGLFTSEAFLRAASVSDSRTILPAVSFPALADKSKDSSLQGFLYPDTYRVFATAKPEDVVFKLISNFEHKLTDEDRVAIKESGMTIFDTITLASIVEKEERKSKDKPIVAGVFLNRLKIGMALQSDATINYVTKKGDVTPSSQDLEVDSAYNTYLYKGLPPGPICNPSIETIRAVIKSQDTDYVYFLHAPSGETIYGKTADEHNANKAKYLR